MKNLPKPCLIEERYFPFECSDSYGVEDDYRTLHWHREMEICYIKQGTGKYLINGTDYSFEKGDMFIINNDDIHLCHDDKNLIMQVIMFEASFICGGAGNPLDYEYLRPFMESPVNYCQKLDGKSPYSLKLIKILSEIEQEYSSMNKGYELIIKSLLLKFMSLIIRYFSVEECSYVKEISSVPVSDKIRNILIYIENNYQNEITLKFLSEKFNISIPYLCSSFKCLTGISPIDFVIRNRIAQAKYELTSTKKDILTISQECGFRSLSNFNHLFKTLVGCCPSAYRKT